MLRPAHAGGVVGEAVFTVLLNDARVVGLNQGVAADGSTWEIVTIESKVVQVQYRTDKPRTPLATLPAKPAGRVPASQPALVAAAPAVAMGAPGGPVASDADIDRALGGAALWAADKIDQFQQTELGRNLQALPPEGAAVGGLKAGLQAVGRLAKAGEAAKEAGSIRSVNAIGGKMNCVNCVIATDATLAGRPTSALGGGPFRINVLEKAFGGRFGAPGPITNVSEALSAAGPGARGIVFGARGSGEVGHVFNVVNQNGVVRFLDGQTGRAASLEGYQSFQLLRTN